MNQRDGNSVVQFSPVQTHLIEATSVKQTFQIQVALPPRTKADSAPIPVVYVTDGNVVFNMFKDIAWMLQGMKHHPFPHCAIVGIGYPSDLPTAGILLRTRDLITPACPQVDMETALPLFPVEGILTAPPGEPCHGRADDFLKFLEEELVPFIETTYPVSPDQRTYFGHSAGGFFGLHALFGGTDLFQNYVISSPGLATSKTEHYVNDFDPEYGLSVVRRFVAGNQVLRDKKLYLSVGGEEDFQPAYRGMHLTSGYHRLVSLLKDAQIPGLEVQAELIPGETHLTVWPIAFMHGLQAIFGMRRLAGLY